MQRLNSFVPSIRFTLERENNGKLPFLDLELLRTNDRLEYKIYRKPTNNMSFIHRYSSQPKQIKQSAFRSMFLRALNVVSPRYLDEEIDLIYRVGYKHQFDKLFLDRCYKLAKDTFYRTRNDFTNNDTTTDNFNNVLSLPYFENFKLIKTLLRNLNIKVVFKSNQTIKHILTKNSENRYNGGIYEIACMQCEKVYIGQSGRSLAIRSKEHRKAVQTADENNSIFLHVKNCNHAINFEGSKLIFNCNNYHKRNYIESCLIKFNKNKLMNIHEGMYKIDDITNKLVSPGLSTKLTNHKPGNVP